MKNTKVIIIAGVVITAFAAILIFLIVRNISSSSDDSSKDLNSRTDTKLEENSEEAENRVSITQAQLTFSAFTTDEGNGAEAVHVVMMPFFHLNYSETIKELELRNFSVVTDSNSPQLIHPTNEPITDCQSYIMTSCDDQIKSADIIGGINKIVYSVGTSEQNFNQVLNSDYGSPQFRIILKDLGTIYPDTILDQQGVYDSGKILEYLNPDSSKLDASIQFDLYIKFDDGELYQKRFNAEAEGSKIINEDFYLIDMRY